MKQYKIIATVLVFLLLISTLASGVLANTGDSGAIETDGEIHEICLDTGKNGDSDSPLVCTTTDSLAIRQRPIELHSAFYDAMQFQENTSITLNLFDDVTVISTINTRVEYILGITGLLGDVEGSEWGYVALSFGFEAIYGTVEIPENNQRYIIHHDSDTEMHYVTEVDVFYSDEDEPQRYAPTLILDIQSSLDEELLSLEPTFNPDPWEEVTVRVGVYFTEQASATLPGLTRAQTTLVEESAYTAHDPIRINGNAGFAAQAAAEGWPGDGSEGNPYIIEGYEIDGAEHEHCILINNTNMHFELRGNYVHGSKYGISFEMVQNAIIRDNRLSNNNYSIKLLLSNKNVISNNTVSNNNWAGIRLIASNNNELSNNTISNQKYGVVIAYSDENIVVSNTISNASDVGVEVTIYGISSIHSNVIRNNTYINNRVDYRVSNVVNEENTNEIPATYIGLILVLVAIFTATLVIWKRKKNRREGE